MRWLRVGLNDTALQFGPVLSESCFFVDGALSTQAGVGDFYKSKTKQYSRVGVSCTFERSLCLLLAVLVGHCQMLSFRNNGRYADQVQCSCAYWIVRYWENQLLKS